MGCRFIRAAVIGSYLLGAGAALFWTGVAQAKPQVLASLKPLALIAAEVAGDAAQVDTLLPVTGSHHEYPMRVSDHKRLQQADIIVWVGPELESFLQKPLATMNGSKVITAYNLKGIYWPAQRPETDDGHHHEHDPHLWLDPRNAVVVAQAVTANLIRIDVANTSYYKQNLASFSQRMVQLDKALQISLRPLTEVGFAVYHEGFSHFVSRYGLHQLDYVTYTPEQKPGARHMHQLREKLAKEGKCLFLEPYNDMEFTHNLARELHLNLATLDAMGTQSTSYGQLIEQMSAAFSACLANGRNQ